MYGSMATVIVPGVIVLRLLALALLAPPPPEFAVAVVLAQAATGRQAASSRASHQGLPCRVITMLLSPALTAGRVG